MLAHQCLPSMLHSSCNCVFVSQRLLGDSVWKILHHSRLGQPLVFCEGIKSLHTGVNNKTLPPLFTRAKNMWWFLLRNVNIPIMSAVQSTGPPLRAAGGNKDGSLFTHTVISSMPRIRSELNRLT